MPNDTITSTAPEALMTFSELVGVLRISPRKAYQMQSAGRLLRPTVSFGRAKRYSPADVREWIGCGCPKADAFEAHRRQGNVK